MIDGTVAILWDESYLWGLMVHRAMTALGLPHRFIMAQEIAQGVLLRKRPAALVVPGGSARRKSQRLGRSGLAAIREYVGSGGFYLGFCGGAGLALSASEPIESIGLCPWHRMTFPERVYHLISGHLLADTARGTLALPVWWPGRFAEAAGDNIRVLARYISPGADLWLADLPWANVPREALLHWQQVNQMDASLNLASGQPLVISGTFGKGQYLLSYAHLETPASPDANSWLAYILGERTHLPVTSLTIPPWHLPHAVVRDTRYWSSLTQWCKVLARAMELGFFFERTTWLRGWRRGTPGMACNHLLACLDAMAIIFRSMGCNQDLMLEKMDMPLMEFYRQAELSFWNIRLGTTLAHEESGNEQNFEQNKIFGHPMLGGGQIQHLLHNLEDLIYSQQNSLCWSME